ncbi:hypothetical protein Cgig2_030378 [Carnegiea gigantea]|uniref:Seven-in-absentia protein TRAF-like domain-containing protein n=1 Tax=Carnegiea gigantea TaxID=171969 RepID=A0A9Q1QK44_9CARY|nr:hypothetical protein Cgig2_030378 [Carnegiea gigantea]
MEMENKKATGEWRWRRRRSTRGTEGGNKKPRRRNENWRSGPGLCPNSEKMDLDGLECVSSIDMDEDETIYHQTLHQFSSLKLPHSNNGVVNSTIHPTTSVHELLECPVCSNSMYPPIHQDEHKVDMHSGCTFNHRYVKSNPREVENATWMLTVFHCFGEYFCLHFEAFQLGMAPVYMAFLRFMGDETEARNYTYSLEVGGFGRKLTWEGKPRSIRDSHRKVRDSHDGLIIQRNVALFFSGGDRKELKLRVTGRIWREQHGHPDGGACIPNLCS